MNSNTKLAIWTLAILTLLVMLPKYIKFDLSETFKFEFEFESNTLKKIVNKNIDTSAGFFAVYIENLSDEKEQFKLNETTSFPAASLYKLVLMASVFKEIEDGKLKLDKKLTAKKSYLTDVLGAVDFGYEQREEQISYSVDEALKRVSEISDNFASIMLTEALKDKEKLNKMAKSQGMENTKFKEDKIIETTAEDMGIYFRKLYRGEIVSKQASEKIIELLSRSRLNNRIPAKLPAPSATSSGKIKIAHKTGEFPRVRHDAGIVFLSPAGPNYIIILMSKDLKDENKGVEILANISKEVYEYFSKESQPKADRPLDEKSSDKVENPR